MIERVARALCKQYEIDDGFSEEQAQRTAESEMWRNFQNAARAAIAAMREPTADLTEHPSYLNGEWSRRNIEAYIDATLELNQ